MTYAVRFATTVGDKAAAFDLRRAVFEVEQNVPRPLDRDALDDHADHVVAFDDTGRCVGTGRIVRLDSRTCQLGRMAVPADRRRSGIGAAVLDALEHMAALRGLAELVVHAQLPAEAFYRHHGYETDGAAFAEEGVPHVLMRKRIVR